MYKYGSKTWAQIRGGTYKSPKNKTMCTKYLNTTFCQNRRHTTGWNPSPSKSIFCIFILVIHLYSVHNKVKNYIYQQINSPLWGLRHCYYNKTYKVLWRERIFRFSTAKNVYDLSIAEFVEKLFCICWRIFRLLFIF